ARGSSPLRAACALASTSAGGECAGCGASQSPDVRRAVLRVRRDRNGARVRRAAAAARRLRAKVRGEAERVPALVLVLDS
ncbi:MAG TPA: hypothetical protein VFP46_00070, partial [Candidatus Paceibacterota bacterium]|nr:hypothetical protein [Candidatus Paceibacterota bacterium]